MSVRAIGGGAIIAALSLAACSGGGDDAVPEATAPTTTEPAPADDFEPADQVSEPVESRAVVPLAEVCPDRIVVQVSGLPTPRLGPLYTLLASGAEIADDGRSVSGPLRRPGQAAEDVTLEIRTGGPSIGFVPAIDVGASDRSVHLVTTSIADLAPRIDSEASAVVALSELNDRMVMWSATAHPRVTDLDALGTSGIEIRHVTAEPFVEFLVANGVLEPGQLVSGGSDAIAEFVTEAGAIARQGDSVTDPPLFAEIAEWDDPLTVGEASSRGWLDVEPVLATIDDGRLDPDCLDQLVPTIQAAIPAYDAEPAAVNELMAAVGLRVDPFSLITASVLDAASDSLTLAESPGAFDLDRIDAFLPSLSSALGTEVRPVDDVVETAHLDPAG